MNAFTIIIRYPDGRKSWTTFAIALGYSFGELTAHSIQNADIIMSNVDSTLLWSRRGSLLRTSQGMTARTERRVRSSNKEPDSLDLPLFSSIRMLKHGDY